LEPAKGGLPSAKAVLYDFSGKMSRDTTEGMFAVF
jgi:hypothetical protein